MEPKPAPFPKLRNFPLCPLWGRQVWGATPNNSNIKSLELRKSEKQQNEGPRMMSYQPNSKHERPDYNLNTGAHGAHNSRNGRLGADVKILLWKYREMLEMHPYHSWSITTRTFIAINAQKWFQSPVIIREWSQTFVTWIQALVAY